MSDNYYIMYKNTKILKFNVRVHKVEVIKPDKLPVCIGNMPHSYDMVVVFCESRLLMMSRVYCKEILTASGIDDQSAVNICIISKALSFRDNYWIKEDGSDDTWDSVNLYANEFSSKIARVSITGNMNGVTEYDVISDKVYTGELTNKGTRAKCFYRVNGRIFLYKNENLGEIKAEVLSSFLARCLNMPCSDYYYKKFMGKDCSVCEILTSPSDELVPAREFLQYFHTHSPSTGSDYYKFFLKVDTVGFLKMQIFDYLTLNTDRNRDNFGLKRKDGFLVSMYPMFDHDSCFKGKSANGIYFPTGVTFKRSIDYLIYSFHSYIVCYIKGDLIRLKTTLESKEGKSYFLKYKNMDELNGLLKRLDYILDNLG